MGGVENHWPAGIRHHPKPAHIHHQIVVAERRPALRQHHLPVARRRHLFGGMMDIVRRDKLAFLDIDDAARAPRFQQQIRLAAKERRDLDDIDSLGRRVLPARFREHL